MKTLLIILGISSFSFAASAAPIGAKITREKDGGRAIYIECTDAGCANAHFVVQNRDELTAIDPLVLPMGNDLDPYQERWGIFNEVLTEASIRMPPVPEFRYLYLMNRSTKEYREALKLVEASAKAGATVEMRDLFFDKFEEVLLAANGQN